MVQALICLVVVAFAPLGAMATEIRSLSEKDRASYCSGVFGQQSLLFLQVASIHKKHGKEDKYKSARYNSDQLSIRAETLGAYGGNSKLTDRGYEDTGEEMRKAQTQGRNPLGAFYNKTMECFDFYKSLEKLPDFQKVKVETQRRKNK
jgi:hypothetical protein